MSKLSRAVAESLVGGVRLGDVVMATEAGIRRWGSKVTRARFKVIRIYSDGDISVRTRKAGKGRNMDGRPGGWFFLSDEYKIVQYAEEAE